MSDLEYTATFGREQMQADSVSDIVAPEITRVFAQHDVEPGTVVAQITFELEEDPNQVNIGWQAEKAGAEIDHNMGQAWTTAWVVSRTVGTYLEVPVALGNEPMQSVISHEVPTEGIGLRFTYVPGETSVTLVVTAETVQ